jgi:AraC-like DNA-binding protein
VREERLPFGSRSLLAGPMSAHIDESRAVARSFAIAEDSASIRARPHAHTRHQLLYASRGVLTLLTEESSWLLPPERAAFLPAGLVHRVRSEGPVSLRTLYLDPSLSGVPHGLRVFELPALGRELVLFAMRYVAGVPLDTRGVCTFSLVAELSGLWAESPCPFDLPGGQTPEVRRAIAAVRSDLSVDISADDVARAAGLSVRSLHRKLVLETGLGFRDYLQRARVLAAMAALAEPHVRVTDVAARVGFESLGAFARAFRKVAGESPSEFRERAKRGPFAPVESVRHSGALSSE